MRRSLRAGLMACAMCAASGVLHAAGPTFWQVATEADFLKGEVENLSIDGYGRLTIGPTATHVYDAGAPFLWTMVAAPDGTTYIGSGNEGQVYRIDAAGRGSVFFDAEELEVHALALAPGDGLYVATSPDGRIYKVDAAGRGTPFFDPPDKYIWSLAVDAAGSVFAGTGDKGVIYKIAPDGTGNVFYQTKATHAMTLAFDRQGRLLAGTESPGRLFRLDASGKPFVLLDSPYNEVHALRVDANGVAYVAAIGGRTILPDTRPFVTEPTQIPVASVSTEITAIAIVDVPAAAAAPAPAARAATGQSVGAIYRVFPDGTSDLVWESREDSPYDLAFEADGSLIVATGGKGKVYRLSGDPLQPTLIMRETAQQVTAMLRDRGGRILYTTSNPGRLSRLSPSGADRGTYTSDVRDAQSVATWGALRWQAVAAGGARVEIATRSGNTRTPDETWSDWSAPYSDPSGSAIVSPRARYLQWRAVMVNGRADAPSLTSVTAAYLPRNARPKVTSITVNAPGTVYQRPFPTDPEIAGYDGEIPDRRLAPQTTAPVPGSAPSLGRRAYQKGLLTLTWRAEDENRDDMTYDVLYRREGAAEWTSLRRGLTDTIVVWDTGAVPNGRYIVRVVASDRLANAPAMALSGSLDSSAFDIDNTPPTITVTATRRDGGRTLFAFDVRDDGSSIQKAEYSIDGDRWQAIYPKDGIADSRLEQFELTLDGDAGVRGVILRATDALNNASSLRAEATPASDRR